LSATGSATGFGGARISSMRAATYFCIAGITWAYSFMCESR
jgi:hypothetical protein